jgi:hypothetical protein
MNWDEPAPQERAAQERSWEVVRSAWEARARHPQRATVRRWPVLALACGLAVLAAALSPPGLAVLGSLKDAVRGTRDELTSLPAPGRLLVNAPDGAWVVQRDGSKRLLSGYLDASWSPHGIYLAAARANDLVALEPGGRIHWTVTRSQPIGLPEWTDATPPCCRIAYVSGAALRVVNGDGTGDRLIAARVSVSPVPALAWRPGTHELAYTNARHQLVLVDVDHDRVLWRRPARDVAQLAWSDNGLRLFAASGSVFDPRGRLVASVPATSNAAFRPHSTNLALATAARGRSSLAIYSGARYQHRRPIFSGPGVFAGVTWSPNARWLLLDWSSADQWMFIRVAGRPRVIPVGNIGRTFRGGPEARSVIAGWCCP